MYMIRYIHRCHLDLFVDMSVYRQWLQVLLLFFFKQFNSALADELDDSVIVFINEWGYGLVDLINAKECSISKDGKYPSLYTLYCLFNNAFVLWFPWSCRLYCTVVVATQLGIAFIYNDPLFSMGYDRRL